jgi:hypothetical protein
VQDDLQDGLNLLAVLFNPPITTHTSVTHGARLSAGEKQSINVNIILTNTVYIETESRSPTARKL